MISRELNIGTKIIGDNHPVFIVAELSANHNHDFNIAAQTIRAAKNAGADAIKLQTYTPDTITIDCSNKYFQITQGTLWDGKTLYALYTEAYTPWEWHKQLKEIAESEGLVFFSTPFDFSAVDFLETIGVPAYKIASFEITDIPLIEYVALKGKPVIISTGIATFADIKAAVDACRKVGNEKIIVLKCTSAYPTPIEEMNLKTILDIKERFKTIVGLSDHSLEIYIVSASVALGAKIIEKHFILDKSLGGPDAAFSLNPNEFKQMVDAVRKTEIALGAVSYVLTERMQKSREHSRSLFIVKDIKEGETFTNENVRSIRPGFGLHPKYLKDILDKKANKDLMKGTPLTLQDINNSQS